MKQDEFFKIVGILIVCFFIIYMVVKMFHLQTSVIEGLTNASETDSLDATSTTSTTSTTTNPSSGEAGNSSSYAAAIKAQTIKISCSCSMVVVKVDTVPGADAPPGTVQA